MSWEHAIVSMLMDDKSSEIGQPLTAFLPISDGGSDMMSRKFPVTKEIFELL